MASVVMVLTKDTDGELALWDQEANLRLNENGKWLSSDSSYAYLGDASNIPFPGLDVGLPQRVRVTIEAIEEGEAE